MLAVSCKSMVGRSGVSDRWRRVVSGLRGLPFRWCLLVGFCAIVWVGIQLVGYAEFDTARHLALTGTFAVDAATAAFADVTPASGLVSYRLSFGSSENVQGTVIGTMLVQMTDGAHIRAEIVAGSGGILPQFSPAAQTYTR